MPPMASYLDTMTTREAMQRTWDRRNKPERGWWTLMFALAKCLWRPNLDVVLSRIMFTIFRYGQPLLISRTITYVSSNYSPLEDRNEAFRLILLTFVLYTGMALFNGMYDLRLSRVQALARMAMVGIIHNRCLTIKDGVFDDSAAVTLMNNDTEMITYSASLLHELWAQVLELGIGMYLLASEIGWVSIMPLLIVGITYQGAKFVTINVAGRQKALSMATQTRISTTKAILDSMKNIKMMGLVEKMEAKIQTARNDEIKKYISFNWLIVAFNLTSGLLSLFGPVITLIVYAIQAELRGAEAIDVNLAFTSLAMIGLVTGPANTILVLMPNIASLIASVDRITKYLLSPDREDKREFLDKRYTNGSNGQANGITPTHTTDLVIPDAGLTHDGVAGDYGSRDDPAIFIGDATIRPASTAEPVLKSITTTLKKGSLVVCCGAVGTGKTTLAKALLGDLPPDTGVIQTSFGSIAYCAQTAWLINGTIKDIIRGPPGDDTAVDDTWYKKVLHACDLEEDLEQLPEGDQTLVGSRGITLSGGQKQRVALARAVHTRRDMIILDDVLSALDATTERHIVDNLIGPKGLFKELGTTVLLITHATQHLPLADHIIKITNTGTAYYFGAIGADKLLLLVFSMSSYSFFLGFAPYWLKLWAESGGQHVWYYAGIYFLISLCAFLVFVVTVINIFIIISPRSGNLLHSRLLRTVMGAPQSYFAATDTGTTLNRFSADTSMIDRRLPLSLLQVGQFFFRLLSQCVLLGVVQPFMAITLPFTFLTVYFIQKFYLATSRQLRFLDLETRAQVNASFLETLEGVATIRAFGWQRPFINDNVKKLDRALRPSYMMMCIQRWLSVVLDLTVLSLALLVISLAVALKGTTTGGQIGIAFNVVLAANMYLLRLVEAWTSMETSLGAISRLRTFCKDVQPEDKPDEVHRPPQLWPSRGAIDFDHISASYNPGTLALKSVNITIEPGKKVGVCGRTGSGKSSLLLSLLRLIEIESGTIKIDDLDVQTLPRNAVRSRLITVPQDPMLVMTDTVRQNLDIAESAASDDDIIRVLERVKLWSVLQSRTSSAEAASKDDQEITTAMGGATSSSTPAPADTADPDIKKVDDETTPASSLDATMKNLPLSHGQQQLFSLARAMLMRPTRGKVVLLDEATSNVDGETNNLMQRLIREEFREHTIVTVAHHLDTIMDSDVVLVLDSGKLVEAGAPSELAAREGGVFRALYGRNRIE
ncbi:ABC transporter [Apodospora peruviana]|uniref:ABC transporter n=1 Tax=Apodospora peruviana TaxID=516989 RepID=A0AAE0I6G1_9PEZI|nr:ABC transporter [Apodospora peruviana]